MKNIQIAYEILSESRKLRNKFSVTGKQFDKVHANMYSVFECYAHGIIDWNHAKTRLKTAFREYVTLYKNTPLLKEEKAKALKEYNRIVTEFKPVLDTYKKVSEQKMIKSLLNKGQLNESQAQQQSNIYFNRGMSELQLNDVALTESWNEVVNTYPNLTTKDQARVRMLTIFEGPTVDTTQMITTIAEEPTAISGPMQTSMRPRLRPRTMPGEDPGFEFNPNAGHRDQPSHPENRGLTNPRSTSPRPKLRPRDMDQRAAINRAVNQAMGEGYKILPPMDKEKYQERPGLEGPFSTLSGKVVYYDPKEGSYYDPDTDMYLSYDEFKALDNDRTGMKESARGLGSIDWPDVDEDGDSAMAQHAENAIRHGMHAYDAYDHVYSMSRDRDWLSDNKDMIIDMFAQYGLATESVNEEMSDDEIDAFHRALDALVHKHLGHGSHEVDERKMTKKEKSKEKRLKKKYDDSDMKASMKKQYGDDWESVYYATIRKQAMESEGKFDGHDIMSEDPPNGIDFDYANLSKVNWAQYSKEDIDTFYSIVDNLDFESGYYGDIDDRTDMHFNALKWLEDNVLSKMESNDFDIDLNDPDQAVEAAFHEFKAGIKKGIGQTEMRMRAHEELAFDIGMSSVMKKLPDGGKSLHQQLDKLIIDAINKMDFPKKESRAPDHNMQARMRLNKIMQQAIKDSKKKRGIEDEDEKDRTDEMTSAGAIASVAQPMGKMQRRKKTDEAHPNSKVYDKCWDGYEKVPGKKRGEPGSCRKKD